MISNWRIILLLLSPVFLVQLGLAIYALRDLFHRKRVRGSRGVWAVILVVTAFTLPTGIIVSGLYLSWGRQVEASDDLD